MLGLIPANFEEAYINQHVGLIRFVKIEHYNQVLPIEEYVVAYLQK